MADEIPGSASPPMAPPMPTPPGRVPPGNTAPATMAPDMAGRRMEALVQISMHLDGLERALGLLGGSATDDGRELMGLLLKARKRFGGAEPDLQRQQLKTMGQGIPPVQQPTPQQGQAFGQAAKSMMRSQGVPGAA